MTEKEHITDILGKIICTFTGFLTELSVTDINKYHDPLITLIKKVHKDLDYLIYEYKPSMD